MTCKRKHKNTLRRFSRIDEQSSLRILFIASELLEMLQASSLALADFDGIEGLVRIINCGTPQRLVKLLRQLDGYWMPELTYDGLFEMLYKNGFCDEHLESAIEFGLIEMNRFHAEDSLLGEFDEMERLDLTELGRQVVELSESTHC